MLKWIDVLKRARYGNPAPDHTVEKSTAEWEELLSPEVFRITRRQGTEAPNSSVLCTLFSPGEYRCACCNSLLFDPHEKYESESGWPSFSQPVTDRSVSFYPDYRLKPKRIEVRCTSCQAHLGHVFPDGPAPAGLRFCLNGLALEMQEPLNEKIVLGGGCFWCTEAIFQQLKGVISVESGYAGGRTLNPTYREVCSGLTGHAEVVRITFDPKIIAFEDLLRIHLSTHNPTLKSEKKEQYRSIILTYSEEQTKQAREVCQEIQAALEQLIQTEIAPLEAFIPAEEKHQNYYRLNPDRAYCQAIISPKLNSLRQHFLPFLAQK